MKFRSWFLAALIINFITIFSASAEDGNPFPRQKEVEERMQQIYQNMATGKAPTILNETQYYQGACITSYSAVAVPQVYSALLALQGDAEGKLSISYGLSQGGTVPAYTLADIEKLRAIRQPKEKPYTEIGSELNGAYLKFMIAEATPSFPQIVAYLSVEKANEETMNFIAPLMGYYCELKKIK